MKTLKINGQDFQTDVDEDTPLLWVIRDEIGLTGTKFGCGIAACGACTIHVDGVPVRSCQYPLSALDGEAITTIEGLGSPEALHALQTAWIEHQVAQCGYCPPGQLMSAAALLKDIPEPTDVDIDDFMSGNLCRCGTYPRIRAAIHAAAKSLGEGT